MLDYFFLITILGEAVPANEQMALNVASTKNSTAQVPLSSAKPVEASGEILAPPTSVMKEFEEERSRLYQQLDEKVCHVINHMRVM